MQNAARVIGTLTDRALGEVFLGPAEVIEVNASEVKVELPDGAVVRAELALAFPYEPSPGDTLLVIGKGGDHYSIGVLRGTGRAALSFQGDVDLRAVGGSLTLAADKGVEIEGQEVLVRSRKLRMVAESVIEKFTSVYQRVGQLLSVHAKEMHTVVEETSLTQAKSASITTEETVTVNGKQIHLG